MHFLTSPALITAVAMAIACATLSVFVVSRRWAFIGEGISHSGFGGAGTVWLLAALLPGSIFERSWAPYVGVVIFSLGAALAIGYLTRGRRVGSDTAIGIFMVASFAWGVIGQSFYRTAHGGADPVGWSVLLFGEMRGLTPALALASVLACAAVVAVVGFLAKEILYYCFDPAMAEASGVRAGFIHYLMMFLVAMTIIIGARIVGTVLVTALLVLPGATALTTSKRLGASVAGAIVAALIGTIIGLLLAYRWPWMPAGPAIVLTLFAVFLSCYGWSRFRGA